MNTVVGNINSSLDKAFNNKTFTTVVSLLLALYAGAAAPALPNSVILFFDTLIGKVLMVFLIAYVSSKNTQMAIMLAISFIITLNLANNFKLLENFSDMNVQGTPDVSFDEIEKPATVNFDEIEEPATVNNMSQPK